MKLFWLDNDEPDINPWHPENLRFFLGNGVEVASIYPLLHQRAYYEGLKDSGESEILTISRSGWAGSQRYGAAIWSGGKTFVRAAASSTANGIPSNRTQISAIALAFFSLN